MSRIVKKKLNIKTILSLLLSLLCILNCFVPMAILSYADQNQKKEVLDFIKESPGFEDSESSIKSVYTDNNIDPSKKDARYLMYRILRAKYFYNVDRMVDPQDEEEKKMKDLNAIYSIGGEKVVCNSKYDGNILYHNCDVPTVLTELRQNLQTSTSLSPLINAGRSSATEKNGFGVPKGIPNDIVYLNAEDSTEQYTGLERFGYNLPITSYKGEWDFITVNTQARTLSNFGIFDSVRLGGSALLNGVGGLFSGLVTGFSWNPIKWIGNAISNAVGETAVTILDTSEANVIMLHAWGRPTFAGTVYGAEYLPAKLVVEKADHEFQKFFLDTIEDYMEKDKELSQWLPISEPHIPKLVRSRYPKYSNQKEYDQYVKDRERYEREEIRYNDCIMTAENKRNCGIKPVPPKKVIPVPLTEDEVFDYYKKDPETVEFFKKAESKMGQNALTDNENPAQGLADLRTKHEVIWTEEVVKRVKDSGKVMARVYEKMNKDFFDQNKRLSPYREIARWVCPEDPPPYSKEQLIRAPYLFEENGEETNRINPACGNLKVRPTIKGGLIGTGDMKNNQITDTRWIAHQRFMSQRGMSENLIVNFFDSARVFFIKLTNTILSFSFGNLIEEFQLDKIGAEVIRTIKEGIFLPLASLAFAASAIWMLIHAMRTNSFKNFFIVLATMIIIFFISMMVMNAPEKTLRLIDEIPHQVDMAIANGIYASDSQNNELCYAPRGGAIRSIQCELWEAGVFIPWLERQWGVTDWKELNANQMRNQNSDLVGSPRVNMGGGKVIENWALYQLSLTKTGTLTMEDPDRPEGVVDKNMYRLVDLQAGPNNAEKSDTRFFDRWAGFSRRSDGSILGLVFSIVALLVLGRFAVYKIELSFGLIFNIILLPFMGLIGILPNGQQKFKDHLVRTGNILLKRCFVTIFIAVTLKLMLAVI